jgi:hypothetical protein
MDRCAEPVTLREITSMSNAYPCRGTFWQTTESGFYFRIRGYGLSFDTDLPVMFSEREGMHYVWRLGRYSLEILTPRN